MPRYRLKIPREHINSVVSNTTIPTFTNSGQYVLFHFRSNKEDFIIYSNEKNEPYRALYVSETLPSYLKPYLVEIIASSSRIQPKIINTYPQLGSDEVGFGDFFGPLVVCSAYVTSADKHYLQNLGITDSKKLSDEKIIMLGHNLSTKILHTKNIVTNPKYNALIKDGYNMNKIKAMLHQNVLVNLARKVNYDGPLYVDKFSTETRFKEYTQGMTSAPIVLVANGEASALSIATASVLARFYFLTEMAKLNKLYNTTIPLGASNAVDEFALTFLKEKGRTALNLITKHNFRNFTDLDEV